MEVSTFEFGVNCRDTHSGGGSSLIWYNHFHIRVTRNAVGMDRGPAPYSCDQFCFNQNFRSSLLSHQYSLFIIAAPKIAGDLARRIAIPKKRKQKLIVYN